MDSDRGTTSVHGTRPPQREKPSAITGAPDCTYWPQAFGQLLREVFHTGCLFLFTVQELSESPALHYFFPSSQSHID